MNVSTYLLRVKSCGAVPNKKERSNFFERAFNPEVILRPESVSKLKLLLLVWN